MKRPYSDPEQCPASWQMHSPQTEQFFLHTSQWPTRQVLKKLFISNALAGISSTGTLNTSAKEFVRKKLWIRSQKMTEPILQACYFQSPSSSFQPALTLACWGMVYQFNLGLSETSSRKITVWLSGYASGKQKLLICVTLLTEVSINVQFLISLKIL